MCAIDKGQSKQAQGRSDDWHYLVKDLLEAVFMQVELCAFLVDLDNLHTAMSQHDTTDSKVSAPMCTWKVPSRHALVLCVYVYVHLHCVGRFLLFHLYWRSYFICGGT